MKSNLFTLLVLWTLFPGICSARELLGLDQGLTLARIHRYGTDQTIAVIADHGDSVTAVNLSEATGVYADIPEVYRRLGYEGIRKRIGEEGVSNTRTYALDDLLSPAGSGQSHPALGFNYATHAKEEKAERRPFLFLKTTRPTRNRSVPTSPERLLDYEVELCARPLASIGQDTPSENIPFGFFICGDFTDRAMLLRNINLEDMHSGKGFSKAKSLDDYFPTGPYMVVPKDRKAFLARAELRLYRNGEIRQQAPCSEMIWSVDEIVRRVFLAQASGRPPHTRVSPTWLEDQTISTNMVLLTGTPEGVIMRPPSLGYKIRSGILYILSGAFLNRSPAEFTLERYISSLLDRKSFLQPGESVTMEGPFLGRVSVDIRRE